MIFEEPSIFGCYLFVLFCFFVVFVRVFSVRRKYKSQLRQLTAGKE